MMQKELNKTLLEACDNNDFEAVKDLVEKGADVNAKDSHGTTPLHWACKNANLKIVKFLVENGADVNAKTNYGSTTLHWACNENNWACNENNLEILKFLVEKGGDIEVKNTDGNTLLDNAKKYNCQKIVQYLESLEDLKKEEITKEKQYNQETTMNSYLSDNINNSVELINKAKENIFRKIDELTKTVQLLDEVINKLDKN